MFGLGPLEILVLLVLGLPCLGIFVAAGVLIVHSARKNRPRDEDQFDDRSSEED